MKIIAALLATLLLAASCSSKKPASEARREESKPIPEVFFAEFQTSKGSFIVEANRAWAPRGAERFYELVEAKFFDGSRFFRVRPNFIVQFGISKDPKQNELWSQLRMPDDPVTQSNQRGFLSFATSGPSTRTTQVFINLGDNAALLDKQAFAPFARVVEGFEIVERLYSGYGEIMSLGGAGPDPSKLQTIGDEYAERTYSRLDKIEKVTIVEHRPSGETVPPVTDSGKSSPARKKR